MNPSLFAFFPALIYKVIFRKNIIRNVDDLWPEAFYDLGIVKSRFFKKILDFAASISYRIPVAIISILLILSSILLLPVHLNGTSNCVPLLCVINDLVISEKKVSISSRCVHYITDGRSELLAILSLEYAI